MSINLEKLYTNACDALMIACRAQCNDNTDDGNALYNTVTKDPEAFLTGMFMAITPALEIWHMAKEEISKSKGGSTYTILKKFIKNIKGYRTDINGAWLDDDGRQCLCDGYRAIRLNTPIEGLKEPDNPNRFDLGKVMATPFPTNLLKLPTSGELKAFIADPCSPRKSDGTVLFDFGDGMPAVNAKFLKDMIDIFPDAIATYDGSPTHSIFFHSEKGDGLLLPIRKSAA
jgi:hypothetical protein